MSRVLIPTILTLTALMVLLYLTGVLSEQIAALMLGVAVVLGACWYAFQRLGDSANTGGETAMILAVTATVAIVAGIPIVSTLIPGSPRAQGMVQSAGDTVPLPEDARGTIRILLHGRVGGTGAADADVVLSLGEQKLEGHFSRQPKSVRMGRRGRSTVMREQNSQFLSAEVPSNVDRIKVEQVKGALSGPLQVEVFRDWIPENVEIIVALILVALASAIAARLGADGAAPGALGVALIFAIMIHRIATPETAIQPEMGSLVVGGIAGLIGGSVMTWLCRRFISPRSYAPRNAANIT